MNFIYSNTYLEFSTWLPSNYIFGFNERNSENFLLQKGIYTLLNKDMLAEVETGKEPGHNIYGSHPIYLMKE